MELVSLAETTNFKGVKFHNLCPHDVTLIDTNGMKLTFKTSGQIARMESNHERTTLAVELIPGVELAIPVAKLTDKDVYGLPEPVEGTIYIASYIVAKHVKRPDVISPLTNETAIRDENDKIIGVRGFQSFA
jgi:hypothetical protein